MNSARRNPAAAIPVSNHIICAMLISEIRAVINGIVNVAILPAL